MVIDFEIHKYKNYKARHDQDCSEGSQFSRYPLKFAKKPRQCIPVVSSFTLLITNYYISSFVQIPLKLDNLLQSNDTISTVGFFAKFHLYQNSLLSFQ